MQENFQSTRDSSDSSTRNCCPGKKGSESSCLSMQENFESTGDSWGSSTRHCCPEKRGPERSCDSMQENFEATRDSSGSSTRHCCPEQRGPERSCCVRQAATRAGTKRSRPSSAVLSRALPSRKSGQAVEGSAQSKEHPRCVSAVPFPWEAQAGAARGMQARCASAGPCGLSAP